jgi:adenylate cyclase
MLLAIPMGKIEECDMSGPSSASKPRLPRAESPHRPGAVSTVSGLTFAGSGGDGLIEWLSGNECRDLDEAGLIRGLGERLRALPLPVDRVALYLRTLHPEIRARIVVWSPEAPIEICDREHTMRHIAAFTGSPVRQVMETCEWRTLRADTDGAVIDRLEVFHSRGIAELLIAPLPSSRGLVSAVSFGTCRAGGFTTAERQALERILPALCGACELRLLRDAEATLLDTYIGPTTRQRILAGHIRRGDVESLEAALLLCDLRDFTGMSNRLPAAQVLERLNLYFDQAVPAITSGGGEILKFIGDAVLAFFQCNERPGASCAAAFAAASGIHARLAAASTDTDILSAGIALHHGKVTYGNIGSGRRLDFTVIGPDVNLVSRIQGVCGPAGHPLLMSARFTTLLGGTGCHSIGRHPLKGFPDPVELFVPAAGYA